MHTWSSLTGQILYRLDLTMSSLSGYVMCIMLLTEGTSFLILKLGNLSLSYLCSFLLLMKALQPTSMMING